MWSLPCSSPTSDANNFLSSWFQTFAVFWTLYVFFWVFPRRQIMICRRFGTLCQFHLQGLVVEYSVLYNQPLKMEMTEGSETSANHNLTPGKYPKEYIQLSEFPIYCFQFPKLRAFWTLAPAHTRSDKLHIWSIWGWGQCSLGRRQGSI
jgi:hypothetical protein